MKNFTSLLIAFIFSLFCPTLINADDNDGSGNTPIGDLKDGPSIRPRTPTDLSGYYSAGILYLHFAEEYASIEIEVTNLTSGDYWQEEVVNPASIEAIQIGEIPGDYQIIVTTSSGNSLYGYFTL